MSSSLNDSESKQQNIANEDDHDGGIAMVDMHRNPLGENKLEVQGHIANIDNIHTQDDGVEILLETMEFQDDNPLINLNENNDIEGGLATGNTTELDEGNSVEESVHNNVVDVEEWFYRDLERDDILHGAFTMEQLKGWLKEGYHFADLVQCGRDGDPMPMKDLLRMDDGSFYTRAEFIEHYGGTDEWDAAG